MDLSGTVSALDGARHRSLGLLDPLPEELLVRQISPIMSPLAWDLAHIGNYEEQWLLRALGAAGVRPELDEVYDAFRHPRRERSSLSILGPDEARSYLAEVRERVLHLLDSEVAPQMIATPGETSRHARRTSARGPTDEAATGLVDEGFVYGMVVQHEHQHVETMLAALQLAETPVAPLVGAERGPAGREVRPAEVLVEAGPFVMGTNDDAWAYDNERPAHVVNVEGFWLDTVPVSNGDYLSFVEAGGYDDPRLWDPKGWSWREQTGTAHPGGWTPHGDGSWSRRQFGQEAELASSEPVQHVSWYEADAFARFAGKRLPTEAEWEKAASWTRVGSKLRYPWGTEAPDHSRANLGQRLVGPAPVGSFPEGASPWGCEQMLGDVWEWTSADFVHHPGFSAFPYREYSEVFFGTDYKVLRGGSWATHPSAVRTTFRNWDFPVRRQIFAGFRCARDA
jgi:gamma-glutamyl hercynylcysteine S-oxide synthase